MKLNQELIAKAKQCANIEELVALAKENDMEITAEEAKDYFEQLNQEVGEIADSELDNVSGGGCYAKDGRLVVTALNLCGEWRCKEHNTGFDSDLQFGYGAYYIEWCKFPGCKIEVNCKNCKYVSHEKAKWLCNNPVRRK